MPHYTIVRNANTRFFPKNSTSPKLLVYALEHDILLKNAIIPTTIVRDIKKSKYIIQPNLYLYLLVINYTLSSVIVMF